MRWTFIQILIKFYGFIIRFNLNAARKSHHSTGHILNHATHTTQSSVQRAVGQKERTNERTYERANERKEEDFQHLKTLRADFPLHELDYILISEWYFNVEKSVD